MICSLEDLMAKEVIDVKTGERLGYIDDVRMNIDNSEIVSLLIYGGYRFFGLFGRESDTEIPCKAIEVVGSDVILVSSASSTKIKREFSKSLFERTR